MRVYDKVEELLREQSIVRDNDKLLLMAVWEEQGLHLTYDQRVAFSHCTPAETITRCRRALKEKYPPHYETSEARYKKFTKYKGEQAYQTEML